MINWDKGRKMYLEGAQVSAIARKLGCNRSSVTRRINKEDWQRAEVALESVQVASASGEIAATNAELSAEEVRTRIKSDVLRVLSALEALGPEEMSLGHLATRERVAGDVLKRAESIFEMANKEQPVVNIAVLSQLPDVAVEG